MRTAFGTIFCSVLREVTRDIGQRVLFSDDFRNDEWANDLFRLLGNGWAAAGMLRVLGTIQHSQYANSMKSEQKDLANWVKEIHGGMYGVLVSI